MAPICNYKKSINIHIREINNEEIGMQAVPPLVNAKFQIESSELEEKTKETKMRLIIENLATSQCQGTITHAKDM